MEQSPSNAFALFPKEKKAHRLRHAGCPLPQCTILIRFAFCVTPCGAPSPVAKSFLCALRFDSFLATLHALGKSLLLTPMLQVMKILPKQDKEKSNEVNGTDDKNASVKPKPGPNMGTESPRVHYISSKAVECGNAMHVPWLSYVTKAWRSRSTPFGSYPLPVRPLPCAAPLQTATPNESPQTRAAELLFGPQTIETVHSV